MRILSSLLLLLACNTPLLANDFDHMWTCELHDGRGLDEVRSASQAWLKAARSMPTGERLSVWIRWPIIAAANEQQFDFVIRAPSLAYWGAFYDSYHADSPIAQADAAFAEIASCSGSMMWELIPVE